MNIKIRIVIESDGGTTRTEQDVAHFERESLSAATLGLTLEESKQMLQGVQQQMVESQVANFLKQEAVCPECGSQLKRKDQRELVYRSVFGKLRLSSPRFFHCSCQTQAKKSFSPLCMLLRERTSPEYLYLQTKFAALVSYGLTVKLLAEVLPLEDQLSISSIRNHVHHLGQRLDEELGEEKGIYVEGCPRDWEQLPIPDLPLTVGIDGGFIKGCASTGKEAGKSFEVIVGKSITDSGDGKCLGFVQTYDAKPRRRLFELLKSQGMQMNQQVTFLSDGGDSVRGLQLFMNPQAEHLLDWFHITMRITVLNQYFKGVKHYDAEIGAQMVEQLERIKWCLWHGNVFKALQKLDSLEMDAEELEIAYDKLSKMLKALREFQRYIEKNQHFITDYGERYRCGERISTGFVESAVNQVIAKRMEKKQQMRWTQKGAHLLLQVRTKVLNGAWKDTFSQWYPNGDLITEMPDAA